MEPRRDDGDDAENRAANEALHQAAMEPRRDDGDDITSFNVTSFDSGCRNGAPS